MRLGALGRRLGISPSTLTRNLLRLEDRGLVERVPDPHDARAVVARLTPDGRESAAAVAGHELRFAESIIGELNPARRSAVVESLLELVAAIRRATETCCPGAYDHLWDDGGKRACCPAKEP
jgi:DNA-binding MarR family transcriptional regulator